MFVLDTDIVSLLHAGDVRLLARRKQFDPLQIATTIITRIEILRGRFDFVLKAADGSQLLRAIHLLARTEELLRQIPVLPFEDQAAALFDRLRRNKSLKKIGRADLLIAATALANGATVVTRNVRHFRQIHGLMVETWVDSAR